METYKCTKRAYNSNMGSTECYAGPNIIFYMDRNDWVNVGDVVTLERNDKGFYKRIWVNGKLKTADNSADVEQFLSERIAEAKKRING